jgi:hypothetical protein
MQAPFWFCCCCTECDAYQLPFAVNALSRIIASAESVGWKKKKLIRGWWHERLCLFNCKIAKRVLRCESKLKFLFHFSYFARLS